jgi:hypothetical protein
MLTNRMNNTEASLAYTRQDIGLYEFAGFRILSEENSYDVEFWEARTGEAASTLIVAVTRSRRAVGRRQDGVRRPYCKREYLPVFGD